jgi:multidrug transporter EmrE-like cation transporter
MNYLTLSFILTSVLLSVLAQISLKFGMTNTELPGKLFSLQTLSILSNKFVFIGLFCYGLSMVFWLYVLTKVEVSRAYPFVGLGFIGTMVFAYYLLNEPLTIQKLFGTLLVSIGIVLLTR